VKRYVPRLVDAEVEARLRAAGAVLLEGPRACGKTESGRHHARSEVRLDTDRNARETAALDAGLVLDGSTPRLLDEWQVVPDLWNAVRRRVDDVGAPGLFILTGSATPPDDVTRHSGAGRFARVRMRPMSLAELGLSSTAVSLSALAVGEPARAPDPGTDVRDVAVWCVRGGWPGALGLPDGDAVQLVQDYLEQILRLDVPGAPAGRDPVRVERVVRSLARHVSTPASLTTIARDTGGERPLVEDTVRSHLDALTRVMVVEDVPAWAPGIRSRSRLRTTPVRQLVDPSLAAAALRVQPTRLLREPEYLGFLFESLVVRDVRVYAQRLGGHVYAYRDNTGLEVDIVVEFADGRWLACEVKLSPGSVDAAAASLLRFAARVDTDVMGPPAALVVVTATGYGYRREDGVDVVPLATLGP
jgi:hypothetical protein